MLDRQRGDLIFECDACGDVLETETSNFDSAMNAMRREGWKSMKIKDVWVHNCSSCGRKT